MSKIRYSPDVDILLIELTSQPIDYAEESGAFIIHFTKSGDPVMLEILNAKEFLLGSLSSIVKGTEAILP